MSRAGSTTGTADALIERAVTRLKERRDHAQRVLEAGGDVEAAHAVVVRLEHALQVLKVYRDMCDQGQMSRGWQPNSRLAARAGKKSGLG